MHTSLATEYPMATHGRDSVPCWFNKIAFNRERDVQRDVPDEHSSAEQDYFQSGGTSSNVTKSDES